MKNFFLYLGAAVGFILPFFNIPFILKIRKAKSAKNISLAWAYGVWVCIVLMLPQVLLTDDWSFKIFGLVNFLFFSVVAFHVWYYRKV
ncbi:MAG: hypothetical protein Q7S68_03225 [Deltaproteobacteria bacterium]|nr:hypothetical protein [Deltaproteobacteria bacterium]